MKPSVNNFFFDLVQKNLRKDDDCDQDNRPLSDGEFIMALFIAAAVAGLNALIVKIF